MARSDREALLYVHFLENFEGEDITRAENIVNELLPYIHAKGLYNRAVEASSNCFTLSRLEATLNLLIDSN